MTSWRTRLASSVVLLLLVAGSLRAAYWLIGPIMPWLVVLGALAAIYLFMMRPSR